MLIDSGPTIDQSTYGAGRHRGQNVHRNSGALDYYLPLISVTFRRCGSPPKDIVCRL